MGSLMFFGDRNRLASYLATRSGEIRRGISSFRFPAKKCKMLNRQVVPTTALLVSLVDEWIASSSVVLKFSAPYPILDPGEEEFACASKTYMIVQYLCHSLDF